MAKTRIIVKLALVLLCICGLAIVALGHEQIANAVESSFGQDISSQSEITNQTSESDDDGSLEPDWVSTGALNDDGTPVTADQGDTPEASGAVLSDEGQPELQPSTFTLSLDLNGGQVNSLSTSGWTQSSIGNYVWSRSVTEETAGEGYLLGLDNKLGGLLPDAPYRAGYSFSGWEIKDNSSTITDSTATISGDATIVAQWTVQSYSVTFQGGFW